MEWTREKRYRRLDEVKEEEIVILRNKVKECPWRQSFHIQPPTGLLNDPNGFSFYNGEYHLFYQWFPLGPVHGLKYWYHMKSSNLVDWSDEGIGITPDKVYESHGAFSGSAIEHKENLYLMYTGNHRDDNWQRQTSQAIAIMKKDGTIHKLETAVIPNVPEDYTDHFRDPKVWKQDDVFYAVIGAQRKNETGCTVLYKSNNMVDWEFKGELKTTLPHFGFMWECPDYFEMDGKGVFVFSPQGIEPEGNKYHNIYQSGYMMGKPLNLETNEFHHGEFLELDYGFDFYAPQTTEAENGRRILVGWMGLPEIPYPTDKNDWAHCLTLPREIKIVNNKLYQVPVPELKSLRKDEENFVKTMKNQVIEIGEGVHYELECEFTNIDAGEVGLLLRVGNGEETILRYDAINKEIILDRTRSGESVATEYGTVRKVHYNNKKIKIRLFMDTSSLEVFINDGEYVFTSRIFPTNNENKIKVFTTDGSSDFQMKKWSLKR